MSQNIKIKEGGTAMTFGGLDRLIVPLSGSGESQWIPKSTVSAPDKSIDKNGTYKASSEGVYGWEQVSVSVQQSDHVTGKGPDGNNYTVSVDDNGDIQETKIPYSIVVTTPPTKTIYDDGDTIDFSGMIVTAYDVDGQSMGEIPHSSLVFPVTVADINQSYWAGIPGINAIPVFNTEHYDPDAYSGVEYGQTYYRGDTIILRDTSQYYPEKYWGQYSYDTARHDSYGASLITVYDNEVTGLKEIYALLITGGDVPTLVGKMQVLPSNYWWNESGTSARMVQNKFISTGYYGNYDYAIPFSTVDPEGVTIDNLELFEAIPVQYTPPDSGLMLQGTFTITVNIVSGGGGQAGENGTGRND